MPPETRWDAGSMGQVGAWVWQAQRVPAALLLTRMLSEEAAETQVFDGSPWSMGPEEEGCRNEDKKAPSSSDRHAPAGPALCSSETHCCPLPGGGARDLPAHTALRSVKVRQGRLSHVRTQQRCWCDQGNNSYYLLSN